MKLILFILPIFLLLTVFAYYPGETITVPNELNISNLVYAIVDNITPITLNVTNNLETITIQFPGDLTPQNFSIIFLGEQKEVQVVHSSGKTKYVEKEIEKNNTIYVEQIQDCNDCQVDIIETENETEEKQEEPKEVPKKNKFIALGLIAIITTILILISRKKEGENGTEKETQ